jgi:hypothetical protein
MADAATRAAAQLDTHGPLGKPVAFGHGGGRICPVCKGLLLPRTPKALAYLPLADPWTPGDRDGHEKVWHHEDVSKREWCLRTFGAALDELKHMPEVVELAHETLDARWNGMDDQDGEALADEAIAVLATILKGSGGGGDEVALALWAEHAQRTPHLVPCVDQANSAETERVDHTIGQYVEAIIRHVQGSLSLPFTFDGTEVYTISQLRRVIRQAVIDRATDAYDPDIEIDAPLARIAVNVVADIMPQTPPPSNSAKRKRDTDDESTAFVDRQA